MPATKEQLVAEFQNLSNKQLLARLEAGTMTRLANEVALDELRARGVDVPPPHVESSQATDGPSDELGEVADEALPELPKGVELVTLLRVVNPLEASVLRMHLESEGLFAYLWGEHLGTTHLIFSMATGGMRLQVRSDQLQRAQEVLAAFERGDYALDSDFEQ